MEISRRRALGAVVIAWALASGVVILIAWLSGWRGFGDALERFRPLWALVALGGQLPVYAGYTLAYRAIMGVDGGPRLSVSTSARIVVAGFGAFAPAGGFGLDKRMLGHLHHDDRAVMIRILGLGAVEYAAIAPAACVSAIVLLAIGSGIHGAVLWPWALAVPAGFALALPLAHRRAALLAGRRGRLWHGLDLALEGITVLAIVMRRGNPGVAALGGAALYWAGEVVSLWGALSAFGGHASGWALVIAMATGYALTRRSTPLAGVGSTEVLLMLALHWVGVRLGLALAATVVYRAFAFALPMVAALPARRSLARLAAGGDGNDAGALTMAPQPPRGHPGAG